VAPVAAERRSEESIDLLTGNRIRDAVIELQLDEPEEERVDRSPRCEELLGDGSEGLPGRDHRRQGRGLAGRTLSMPDRRVSFAADEHPDGSSLPSSRCRSSVN
jgi:hypothetical protein